MDWTKLGETGIDQFLCFAKDQPLDYKLFLSQVLFDAMKNQENSVYPDSVIDLYLSSYPDVQNLEPLTGDQVFTGLDSFKAYFGMPDLTNKRILHILSLAGKLESSTVKSLTQSSLAIFSGKTYYLSSLICGQFHYPDQFYNIFMEENPCTPIGSKIANSLIKVAAKRIFSNPYQSILEPIVNSIDAYSNVKVGKFGLGFYSILYWILDTPDASLTLISHTDKDHWSIKIYEREGNVLFDFNLIEPDTPGLTTILKLDPTVDLNQFKKQLEKLKLVTRALILVDGVPINQSDNQNKIEVNFGDQEIKISDKATGVSLPVLFGSLLVPTISEKTISSSLAQKADNVVDLTTILKAEENKLLILVGEIGVVDLDFKTESSQKWKIILSLSLNTRLPTSRDDIILNKEELDQVLAKVLELFVKEKTIVPLEEAIQQYIKFTSSDVNKKYFKDWLENLDDLLTGLNQVRYDVNWESLYNSLNLNLVASNTANVKKLEEFLLGLEWTYSSDEIFWGKRTVFLNVDEIITNGGTTNLVFVDQNYWTNNENSALDLTLTTLDDGLVPFSLNWGQKVAESIQKIKAEAEEFLSEANLNLFVNFLLRYRKLHVSFKMQDYAMIDQKFLKTIKTLADNSLIERYLLEHYNLLNKLKTNLGYGNAKPWIKSWEDETWINLNFKADDLKEKVKGFLIEQLFWEIDMIVNLNLSSFALIFDQWFPSDKAKTEHGLALAKFVGYSDNIWIFYSLALSYLELPSANLMKKMRLKISSFIHILTQEYTLTQLKEVLAKYLFLDEKDSFYNLVTKRLISHAEALIASSEKITLDTEIFEIGGARYKQIKLSEMISAAFKEEILPKNFLKEIERRPIIPNLQLIEVVINENTTKSFFESVIIELAQNTIDALRGALSVKADQERGALSVKADQERGALSVKAVVDNSFNIKINKDENNNLIISFQDWVGIPPEAYSALMLPFVSTKSSQIETTGEIGSGFFNVYRESSEVRIDSVKNGYSVKIKDVPIRQDDKNNRVIDIQKEILLDEHSKLENKTTITLIVPTANKEEAEEKISQFIYLVKTLLQTIPAETVLITLNDNKINTKTRLISESEWGEARMSMDKTFKSLVLTKSVPFKPLSEFLTKINLPKQVLEIVDNDLLINIKKGFNPVSSRATLNIDKKAETEINLWILEAIYIYLLKKYMDLKDEKSNLFLPNTTSRGSISQLKLSHQQNNEIMSDWILSFKSENMPKNLTSLINDIIENIEKVHENLDSKKLLREVMDLLEKSKIPDIQSNAIIEWFFNKKLEPVANKDVEKITQKVEIPKSMDLLIRLYLKIFWRIGSELERLGEIKGSKFKEHEKEPFLIWYDKKYASANGFYSPTNHSISLSLQSFGSDLINLFKKFNFEDFDIFSNQWLEYQEKEIFNRRLGFSVPSSTLIHELSHAWRQNSHNQGSHDSIQLTINDKERKYKFDDGANEVAKIVFKNNFLNILWTEFNKYKDNTPLDLLPVETIPNWCVVNQIDEEACNEIIVTQVFGEKIKEYILPADYKNLATKIMNGKTNPDHLIFTYIKQENLNIVKFLIDIGTELDYYEMITIPDIIGINKETIIKIFEYLKEKGKLNSNLLLDASLSFPKTLYLADWVYKNGDPKADFNTVNSAIYGDIKNLDWLLEHKLIDQNDEHIFDVFFGEINEREPDKLIEIFNWLNTHNFVVTQNQYDEALYYIHFYDDIKDLEPIFTFFGGRGLKPSPGAYTEIINQYVPDREATIDLLNWLLAQEIKPTKEVAENLANLALETNKILIYKWITENLL